MGELGGSVMAGQLVKSQKVLQRRFVGDRVLFAAESEDEPGVLDPLLYLAPDDFEEFGKPEVITISIEAGDKLNG